MIENSKASASRVTKLACKHRLHVAWAWTGNSAPITHKHYLSVTEDHFKLATKGGAKSWATNGAK